MRKKYQYQFGFRGWWYLFQKKWYSFYRWRHPEEDIQVIDIGAFYFSKEVK
jgi:hypothetical protein